MHFSSLIEFSKFVDREILPATQDLAKLADSSQKHVQKLVYTNLVDRFDSAIDGALLENCREEKLIEAASERLSNPINEVDLVKLLLRTGDLQEALDEKISEALREAVLRKRHSRKLSTLFSVLAPDQECWNTPRIRVHRGTVHDKIKPQRPTVPHSICGFADWLYSRRNTIVHGSGTVRFLDSDRSQIKKLFKCDVAQNIRIQLESTTTAANFYKAVVELLMSQDIAGDT